ncbi:hypothetical protein SAMN05216480_10330 [Pustulibacterium marinum]|uniref:CarboxypepD_reg-like domain-containing protein n=1 Tax=Pustulibacterium marinum TaxID=1224947 RepID=A0A1I7G0I8_9FLAO|nr:hypothetical protein [Pustulibacterium marinum]SFU41969.1 hypothetical protein SAMN05216480_10330 [Pustulibacterium marinum]
MKNKYLKLETPCQEKWEQMTPNEKGSYCDLCSKNVIDFTQLNEVEISEIMKKSGNKICARITHSQLNSPLLNLETHFDVKFPKSKVAAGVILATSLTIAPTVHAEHAMVKTEFVQNSDSQLDTKEAPSTTKPNDPKIDDTIVFHGQITSEDLNKPVEHAKITFVTSQKIFKVYTSKDGTFSLEIPASLIDNDNVIRVSYYEIKEERKNKDFFGYKTRDYILTKKELQTNYSIKAEPEVLILGGIRSYSETAKPIVLSNGVEIKYKEFAKALAGEKSSCSIENKEFLFFDSKFAVAIYGKRAKDGLYILTNKTEK